MNAELQGIGVLHPERRMVGFDVREGGIRGVRAGGMGFVREEKAKKKVVGKGTIDESLVGVGLKTKGLEKEAEKEVPRKVKDGGVKSGRVKKKGVLKKGKK